jgi:hypothetical protein
VRLWAGKYDLYMRLWTAKGRAALFLDSSEGLIVIQCWEKEFVLCIVSGVTQL